MTSTSSLCSTNFLRMKKILLSAALLCFWFIPGITQTSNSIFNKSQLLDYVIEQVTLNDLFRMPSGTQRGRGYVDTPDNFEAQIEKKFQSTFHKPLNIYLNAESLEPELTEIKFPFLGSQSHGYEGFHIYETVTNYSVPYLVDYYYSEVELKYREPETGSHLDKDQCHVILSTVEISVTGHRAAVHVSNSCYRHHYPILFLFEKFKNHWLLYSTIVDKRSD